jgi:hypothetical protein
MVDAHFSMSRNIGLSDAPLADIVRTCAGGGPARHGAFAIHKLWPENGSSRRAAECADPPSLLTALSPCKSNDSRTKDFGWNQ